MKSTSTLKVSNIISHSKRLFPGVMISIITALAARFISEHYGAPVMLMALLFGMAFNFLSEDDSVCQVGIEFCAKRLLRLGVALLGLGITVQQIMASGPVVLGITLLGVLFTLVLGVILALLTRSRIEFGILIGGAVAICGASAALAIASVLPRREGDERDTVFTVISVTALSTLAMIVYPIIAKSLGLSDFATGVFFGSTIHDVAQVVGAGYSVSKDVGDTATFVKLLRVAMLVPVVLGLALYYARRSGIGADISPTKLPLPLFIFGFAALVLIGSYVPIPTEVRDVILEISRWCLVIAISALGMKTSLKRLQKVGSKAIIMICALTALLAVYSLTAIMQYMI